MTDKDPKEAAEILRALAAGTEDEKSRLMLSEVLDRQAVREIYAVLDESDTWGGETAVEIADVVERTGRTIRPAVQSVTLRLAGADADTSQSKGEKDKDKDKSPRQIMLDVQAMSAIHAVLKSNDFSDEVLEVVIDLVEAAGRKIRRLGYAYRIERDFTQPIVPEFSIPVPQAMDAVHAVLDEAPVWDGATVRLIFRVLSLITEGWVQSQRAHLDFSNGRPEFDGRPDRPAPAA